MLVLMSMEKVPPVLANAMHHNLLPFIPFTPKVHPDCVSGVETAIMLECSRMSSRVPGYRKIKRYDPKTDDAAILDHIRRNGLGENPDLSLEVVRKAAIKIGKSSIPSEEEVSKASNMKMVAWLREGGILPIEAEPRDYHGQSEKLREMTRQFFGYEPIVLTPDED